LSQENFAWAAINSVHAYSDGIFEENPMKIQTSDEFSDKISNIIHQTNDRKSDGWKNCLVCWKTN